ASSELHADEGSIGRTSPAMPRRHALPALTEEAATAREMMLSSLLMELDSGRLRRRIVRACRLLLAADRCALFLAEPGGWLRLTADTVAAEAAPTEPEVRVPPGVGIVGNAAATGQTLRLEEAAKDPRFNAAVDELPSCATVRALAAPLKHPDGGGIGLLLATSGAARPPSPTLTRSASLRNSELFQQSQLETKRNEVLLDLVRITFEHMENLELLVNNILQYMRLITRCTWCQILLIDDPSSAEGSFDRVFELLADEADGTDKSPTPGS
uniref:GAF domain-containing protein n=1 Tax=Macrostomum lignano TaxID=282301 RepID=A0A1I8J1Z0_9PLAT